MNRISSHRSRPRMMISWSTVFGILAFVFVCGCVRTTPSLPQETEANTNRLGVLEVRAVDTPPAVRYQRPPTGFVDGLLRGSKHGAVLGVHVGIELAKAFVQRGAEMSQERNRTNRRGGCAGAIPLMGPVMGLLALTAIPPLVTTAAGLQGGFTAHNIEQVEEWEKALHEAQEQLKIQATLRDYVRRTLPSCCPVHRQPSLDEVPSSADGLGTTDLQSPDTILETEILELGLAEVTSEELPEPGENNRAINPIMAKATVPLDSIFQKSSSSLYLLVQTKLLRAHDNGLLDQRKFGYLSMPRPYMDWTKDSASHFRAELQTAYQSLAGQIVTKLVMSASREYGERVAQ